MVGESENKANSASNYVEVEAEAEFGKKLFEQLSVVSHSDY